MTIPPGPSAEPFRYHRGWSPSARLNAANQVRTSILSARSLLPVCEAVAETVAELFLANACTISLLDDRGYRDIVNVGVLAPGEKRFPDENFYPISQFPLSTEMLFAGTGYLSDSTTSALYREYQGMWPQMPEGSFLGVPIISASAVRGELYLARAVGTPAFINEDLGMARDLATQFGTVLPTLLEQEAANPVGSEPWVGDLNS